MCILRAEKCLKMIFFNILHCVVAELVCEEYCFPILSFSLFHPLYLSEEYCFPLL